MKRSYMENFGKRYLTMLAIFSGLLFVYWGMCSAISNSNWCDVNPAIEQTNSHNQVWRMVDGKVPYSHGKLGSFAKELRQLLDDGLADPEQSIPIPGKSRIQQIRDSTITYQFDPKVFPELEGSYGFAEVINDTNWQLSQEFLQEIESYNLKGLQAVEKPDLKPFGPGEVRGRADSKGAFPMAWLFWLGWSGTIFLLSTSAYVCSLVGIGWPRYGFRVREDVNRKDVAWTKWVIAFAPHMWLLTVACEQLVRVKLIGSSMRSWHKARRNPFRKQREEVLRMIAQLEALERRKALSNDGKDQLTRAKRVLAFYDEQGDPDKRLVDETISGVREGLNVLEAHVQAVPDVYQKVGGRRGGSD